MYVSVFTSQVGADGGKSTGDWTRLEVGRAQEGSSEEEEQRRWSGLMEGEEEGSSLGTVGGVSLDFRPKRGDGGRQEV